MAKRNRKTLKNYFAVGSLPTQSHFEDLVDSTLNLMEDGFSRSPENGVEISLVGEQNRLLSFFRDVQLDNPDWSITCETQSGNLGFVHTGGDSSAQATASDASSPNPNAESQVLTLTEDGKVGIQQSNPAFDLDVNGTIRSACRFGVSGFVPADGQWHAITGKLDGCHALEVLAGVGLPGKRMGRYALLHAIALNAFNPTGWLFNFWNAKNKIRCTQAWYLSRADRLKLRWVSVDASQSHAYQLQLKTMSNYDDDTEVQYSITELWPDATMAQSNRGASAKNS